MKIGHVNYWYSIPLFFIYKFELPFTTIQSLGSLMDWRDTILPVQRCSLGCLCQALLFRIQDDGKLLKCV